ncbi:glutaredoxin 3 [Tepidicaulis marinus]|uniref:glutaredoxin 3 n=1 Tax=Tepidicaulis marinus TaxID=1333998 RepID=UPI0012DFE9B3|nr:glutaredoxin 3 [Tepidicaulis marinus]
MANVTIYTTMMCPYCYRAKALLDKKGVTFREIDVGMDADVRRQMMQKAGGAHTVPQIFVGDTHVGGCDELYALEASGKLDPLLAA